MHTLRQYFLNSNSLNLLSEARQYLFFTQSLRPSGFKLQLAEARFSASGNGVNTRVANRGEATA
jgi:hypothetical protein